MPCLVVALLEEKRTKPISKFQTSKIACFWLDFISGFAYQDIKLLNVESKRQLIKHLALLLKNALFCCTFLLFSLVFFTGKSLQKSHANTCKVAINCFLYPQHFLWAAIAKCLKMLICFSNRLKFMTIEKQKEKRGILFFQLPIVLQRTKPLLQLANQMALPSKPPPT